LNLEGFSENFIPFNSVAMKNPPFRIYFLPRKSPGGFFFLPFFLLFLSPGVQAQSMFVSEGISIRNDYGYELIGRLRDRILLFRAKYDDFEVQAFDNQMRLSWTRGMDDLDRRGVQILSVVGSKNDFSVIHKVRRRSRSVLRIHKYDPGANLIDSMMVKDY